MKWMKPILPVCNTLRAFENLTNPPRRSSLHQSRNVKIMDTLGIESDRFPADSTLVSCNDLVRINLNGSSMKNHNTQQRSSR